MGKEKGQQAIHPFGFVCKLNRSLGEEAGRKKNQGEEKNDAGSM